MTPTILGNHDRTEKNNRRTNMRTKDQERKKAERSKSSSFLLLLKKSLFVPSFSFNLEARIKET